MTDKPRVVALELREVLRMFETLDHPPLPWSAGSWYANAADVRAWRTAQSAGEVKAPV